MCGRFTLRTPANRLVEQFGLDTMPELHPRYNIAPTQPVPIIRPPGTGPSRQLTFARWGLIPSWAKEAAIGNRMINARGETVAEKPSFRAAFKRRRCLVVADGYYEWKHTGRAKQPYYIRRCDEGPLAFAGLWESWRGPRDMPLDEPLETCTIITTDANELTSPIHDRMPVILGANQYEFWLDSEFQESAPLLALLQPYDDDDLVADPVSTYVNSPAHDDATCIDVQREI